MGGKLVIIGGCGSSGTTLLTHLMSKSKYICSGPEFNCFNHPEIYNISSLKQNVKNMYDGKCLPHGYVDVGVFMTFRDEYGINLNIVEEWLEKSNDSKSFINYITQHMTTKNKAPVFIEKSPTNVYCFNTIARNYPEYHLVHVIRDGRDVVSSLMRRGFNLFGAGSRWLYDTISGLQARGTKNYIELRYEDLVSSPHEMLSSLFEQLDIPFDPQNVFSNSSESSGQYIENWKNRKEPQLWQQTPSDPISSASVGRFKKDLSLRDIDTLYRIKLSRKTASKFTNSIYSFRGLLELLEYEIEKNKLDLNFQPYSKLKEIGLQSDDYFRRFKRYHSRYFLKFPPVLTFID